MAETDSFGLLGTILEGRYRIERVVGEGGFGVVYLATHVLLEGPVAIKVLKLPAGIAHDKKAAFITGFREEGKLLFQLSSIHSSIVQAREAGVAVTTGGEALPYLALEWLDGAGLDREIRVRRELGLGPMHIAQAMRLLDGVAQGLAIAHERRIAHRDIKPANIFLVRRRNGVEAKLLDFGLAKVLDQSSPADDLFAQTEGAECTFTRRYGAPEQWLRRLGATGPWTDVHALALVLVELVTLEPPLQGDHPAELMAACLDKVVRPTPNARGASLPEAVNDVFLRAVEIDPRHRFTSIGEFWGALSEAVRLHLPGADASLPRVNAFDHAPPSESAARVTTVRMPATANEPGVGRGNDSVGPLSRSRTIDHLSAHQAGDSKGRKRAAVALIGALLMIAAATVMGLAPRSTQPPPADIPSAASAIASPPAMPDSRAMASVAIAPQDSPAVSPPTPGKRNVAYRPPIQITRSPAAIGNASASASADAPESAPSDELAPQEILRDRK